ncbi:MAG: SGNH/GDSL hydrolase family protein [Polyangiales bacterium]
MKPAALAFFLTLVVAGSARAEAAGLSAEVTEHVREIHGRNPDLRDDAFSKMGGSSVASRAFLHCFATPYVELGEHGDLAETVEYFAAGRRNSFNRESDAAGVSWNLRYVLGGRPANFRNELERTQARWALILFGGNDAQNENERVYFKRLVYLVEELAAMGVVPVLGAALPRRNSYKDRWIGRFNAITEAVAKHWSLPYIDYHAALSALPRKGLARDGVHPNVLGQGGLQAACQLTEKGLRYGNNLRNLLTLEMLDAVRKAVGAGDSGSYSGRDRYRDSYRTSYAGTDTGADTDIGAGTDIDAGTGTDPAPVPARSPFPFSALVSKPDLPFSETLPKHCGALKPSSRLYRHSVELAERTRLRASALDLAGYKHRVLWVRVDENGERCVRRRTQTLEVDAKPGMWDLIVEVPERAAREGQMLILITRNRRLR